MKKLMNKSTAIADTVGSQWTVSETQEAAASQLASCKALLS